MTDCLNHPLLPEGVAKGTDKEFDVLRYAAFDAVLFQTSSRTANATYTHITPARTSRWM